MIGQWPSVIPPLIAVILAIITRRVYFSLTMGILLGAGIVEYSKNFSFTTLAIAQKTLLSVGNLQVIAFTLLMGGLVHLMDDSGAVAAFVRWLEERKWVDSKRKAKLLTYFVGLAIFIEANISLLSTGALSRRLFDRYGISREKLAYLIDSTSSPIAVMIPINAWGAYCLSLLVDVNHPVDAFIQAIPYNFYAIFTILLAGIIALTSFDFGPMKDAEANPLRGQYGMVASKKKEFEATGHMSSMVIPMLLLVSSVPIIMMITGNGDITKGSGSLSVLAGVVISLLCLWGLLLLQRFSPIRLIKETIRGSIDFSPMALIMILAFLLGDFTKALGTGAYLASFVGDQFGLNIVLPMIFITAAFTSFATGTSWGTFAIMIPIAVSISSSLSITVSPFIAAALSGGIFGDHASPISDTTIIASTAAGTDHISHVRTQLPYALLAATLSAIAFALSPYLFL